MNSELEKIAYVYGDVCVRRKKQRRKRQKLLVIEVLFDYAKNSTLHGFRYIVDQGLNTVERLFWFLTVIASLLLCSYYIYNVVHKWKISPVIVTVNERLSSVGSVPFPSVTICPEIKVNAKVYNFSEKLEMYKGNISLRHGEEFTKFVHVNALCDYHTYFEPTDNIDPSMVNHFSEVTLTTDDIFLSCKWHDKPYFCDDIFSKVMTDDGVCYTANSMAAEDIFEDTIQKNYSYMESSIRQSGWSLDEGYDYNKKSDKEFYPKSGRVFGSVPDLSLIMIHDPDTHDKSCNRVFSGYKIYLHHPADFPQMSLYYYAAIPDQLSSVAISFHELNSDKDLIAYDTQIRQCYFPSERKLYYFKTYTATNCYAECLSNYTYRECNCVGFHMPHDNSSEICNPVTRYLCMARAKDDLELEERQSTLGLNKNGCHCLPACNTIEYDAEILKTGFRIQEIINNFMPHQYNPLNSYSKVDLFYKKPQFVTMQRRELFGFTDLLANIGGLLGVFLGFSFLSLIEIFYFVTVRVFAILKRDLQEEKLKEKSKVNDLKGH